MILIIRFEFLKSVGNTISKVKLPEGQEADARIIKHISGSKTFRDVRIIKHISIYARSLAKVETDEVNMFPIKHFSFYTVAHYCIMSFT